ncbi:MAG: hypothetical protein HYZ53_11540 [Planctomycetes bacterium]|nr:hypothetical protein [Planctomycetota bacterium]
MSYLDPPRLTFFGKFFANPSTVNNAIENFDPALPLKPGPGTGPGLMGWNPSGAHYFRFQDVTVASVLGADWVRRSSSNDDPIVGATITTVPPGDSIPGTLGNGKIVDLDPDQQLISGLWGVHLRVDIGDQMVVRARMETAQLTDIWFSTTHGPAGVFPSALVVTAWGPGTDRSPAMQALRRLSPSRLSIKLYTDAYQTRAAEPDFNLGRLIGAIGPLKDTEPTRFAAARRLRSLALDARNTFQFYPAPCAVTPATGGAAVLTVDLGHSVPLVARAGEPMFPRTYALVDVPQGPVFIHPPIDLSKATIESTAGIVDLPVDPTVARLLSGNPMAVSITADAKELVLAEDSQGRYVDVDASGLRLNPGESASVKVYALRFGRPDPGQVLAWSFWQLPDGNNNPPGAVSFPATVETGADGTAEFTVVASRPEPLPANRQFIDSQLYLLGGPWQDLAGVAPDPNPYPLSVVVFNNHESVTNPTWKEVGPIFAAYARLYPGMAARVDLASEQMVRAYAGAISGMLQLPLAHPNHMPVTRDLSAYNRDLMLRWLRTVVNPTV